MLQRRRKITPTYHERMIWGQGDGSGLRAVDSKVGRIGQMASLIAPYGSQAALAVASCLDAKIEGLLETAAGVTDRG